MTAICRGVAEAAGLSAPQAKWVTRRVCRLVEAPQDREDLAAEILAAYVSHPGANLSVAFRVGTRAFFESYRGRSARRRMEVRTVDALPLESRLLSFADLCDSLIPANPNDQRAARLVRTRVNGSMIYWRADDLAELFGMQKASIRAARIRRQPLVAWVYEGRIWPNATAGAKGERVRRGTFVEKATRAEIEWVGDE